MSSPGDDDDDDNDNNNDDDDAHDEDSLKTICGEVALIAALATT